MNTEPRYRIVEKRTDPRTKARSYLLRTADGSAEIRATGAEFDVLLKADRIIRTRYGS